MNDYQKRQAAKILAMYGTGEKTDLQKSELENSELEKGGLGSGKHKVGDTFHSDGDESMDMKPGKYKVNKVEKVDDEDSYEVEHESGSKHNVSHDYVHGTGYWKGAGLKKSEEEDNFEEN